MIATITFYDLAAVFGTGVLVGVVVAIWLSVKFGKKSASS